MRWGIIAALVLGCGVGFAQNPSGEVVEEYKRDFEHAKVAYQKAIDDAKEQFNKNLSNAADKVISEFEEKRKIAWDKKKDQINASQLQLLLTDIRRIDKEQEDWAVEHKADSTFARLEPLLQDTELICENENENREIEDYIERVLDYLFKDDKQLKTCADVATNKLKQLTRDKFLLEQLDAQPKPNQASIFLASNFLSLSSLKDRTDIAKEVIALTNRADRADLLLLALPPEDTEVTEKLANAYFSNISSPRQNAVLRDCYADAYGFTVDGIEKVLLGKNQQWRFYWEGLRDEPPPNVLPPTVKFFLDENDQDVSRMAYHHDNSVGEGAWKVPEDPKNENKKVKKQVEAGAGWQLRLRWILQEGGAHQHFPVVDLDELNKSGENPFGENPQFRGWYLIKNKNSMIDRAIGIKPE